MAILTKGPRGTQDIMPGDTGRWQYVEQVTRETAGLFGFREIRFPTFEHTELFNRSVGDTTDVVQKEMYTFKDKGDRSITLRPEGTAGVMRSAVEHGLLTEALPVKLSYLISCFRYEKPQAGRLREFHQFGCEMLGADSPAADAEIIAMVNEIFQRLELKEISLEINSIGCPTCRAKYHEALRAHFSARRDELCDTCRERLEKNPMRLLDCKSPICKEIAKGAPTVLDFLCEDCSSHFEELKNRLTSMGISYTVNPTIVRGLDYYTKTVFEFVSGNIGAQGTVCGGGRYDGLIEQLGGPKMTGIGFAMGLERLLLVMEHSGSPFPEETPCKLYLGSMGEAAAIKAAALVAGLRSEGFRAENDLMGRSVKAQMKYADKLSAQYSAIIGDNELSSGLVKVKNMVTGEQHEVKLSLDEDDDDSLLNFLYHTGFAELTDAIEDAGL
ncbi:MAG: histidine--tRNA ligase [Oscillospiraceae bacterium]|nr:histidine--tRNA ligase [Oscillospiraceae bacterium]